MVHFVCRIVNGQFLQLYAGAKVLVSNTMNCAVQLGKNVVKLNIKMARKLTDPLVETARDYMHPIIEAIKMNMEPSILRAMDTSDPTEEEQEDTSNLPALEPISEERGEKFVGHLAMLRESLVLYSNEHVKHEQYTCPCSI